jgi:ubiquinone/menaquinone biosynthesis C-methylase UbiE
VTTIARSQQDTPTTLWALGDYDRVARDLIAPFGSELVAACAIQPGERVLDVASGTGNVALAAAAVGAEVVACDVTPELLAVGRERADERGLALTWRVADAQALPFPDATFDVVTSSVGVMFAPDQRAAARELVRVCRPGGRIGLINWPPDSWSAEFFGVFGAYAPPPADAPSPLRWGDEAGVRDLLGDAVTDVQCVPGKLVVDHFPHPAAMCDYYRAHFGPVIATYAALAAEPDRRAALDRDFAAFARRTNRGGPGGPAVYHYGYLRTVAEVRSRS